MKISSLPDTEPDYCPPGPGHLKIIFQDEHLVCCDKPSGLLSVPGRGPTKTRSAVSYLQDRLGKVFVVHRLDMDTSGLLIFARTKDAQRHIMRQFEKRRVSKVYEAVGSGLATGESGRIDLAIAKYSLKRPLRHLDPEGRQAITNWSVISRSKQATRFELRPETGRSHQIRLHLKAIGHPILGDRFYGTGGVNSRLLLHARSASLFHPCTNERLSVEAAPNF